MVGIYHLQSLYFHLRMKFSLNPSVTCCYLIETYDLQDLAFSLKHMILSTESCLLVHALARQKQTSCHWELNGTFSLINSLCQVSNLELFALVH